MKLKSLCVISAIKKRLQLYNIFEIVCDRTNVDTGLSISNQVWHYSIDGRAHLFRPLQWLVCLFHCNELTLRALIKKLDGYDSEPRGFKIGIGQQLSLNHNAIRMTNPPAENAQHTAIFESFTEDWSTD